MIQNPLPADYYDRSLDNPVQRYWHNKRFKQVLRIVKPLNGLLLDIGCDCGTFTEKMKESSPNLNIVAIDLSRKFVKYAAGHYSNMPYVVSDGQHLPFKEESFNAMTCLEVLEHVVDPSAVIKEAFRCLKKEGHFIILVPNGDSHLFRLVWYLWIKGKGKPQKEAHIHQFNEDDLEKQLLSPGFRMVKKVKFNFGMLLLIITQKIDEGCENDYGTKK